MTTDLLAQIIPQGADYVRILPELILSAFGIAIMLLDPLVDEEKSQKTLGLIAFAGAVAGLLSTWYMTQNPGRYKDAGFGWNPQTYACAVKRGDQDWLNFVNTALHEAMTGVEFDSYAKSYKTWFGKDLTPPQIGFPVEFK